MLIQVDGGRKAPSIISDEELAAAFQGKFGLSVVESANLMRGYKTLNENPDVKVPLAIEDHKGKPQWMFVLKEDSIDEIVHRWIRTVPVVAEQFRKVLMMYKADLYDEHGFSKARLARLKLQVPTSLYFALLALNDHFWDDERSIQNFLECFPFFKGGRAT